MLRDFFAATVFRAAVLRATVFFGADRFAGAAFFVAALEAGLRFGIDLAFAVFRATAFTALVAFGRLTVELEERLLAADFGLAR